MRAKVNTKTKDTKQEQEAQLSLRSRAMPAISIWLWNPLCVNTSTRYSLSVYRDHKAFSRNSKNSVKFLMEIHLRTSLRVSLAIWDHTMLLATRHKRTHPALTPASEGWYSTPEGWKAELT